MEQCARAEQVLILLYDSCTPHPALQSGALSCAALLQLTFFSRDGVKAWFIHPLKRVLALCCTASPVFSFNGASSPIRWRRLWRCGGACRRPG